MNFTKNVAKAAVNGISALLPIPVLETCASTAPIVMYYHTVSDGIVEHTRHLHKNRSSKAFAADLDFFSSRYDPVSLQQIIDWLNGGSPLPARCFLITFDDGMREFADVALPILRVKGIPSACFVTTGLLDNKRLFFRHKASLLAERIGKIDDSSLVRETTVFLNQSGIVCTNPIRGVLSASHGQEGVLDRTAERIGLDFDAYLRQARPYFSTDEVKELAAEGVAIGAHGLDHRLFSGLEFDQQVEQALSSMKIVRETFGLDYNAFAFPYNDRGVSRRLFEAIFEAGIEVSFGTTGFRRDPVRRSLQRVSFEHRETDASRQLRSLFLKQGMRRGIGAGSMIR